MRCVVLGPKGLKGQRRASFLEEGTKQFQAQMGRKAASKNWGRSDAAVKRFAAAMQEARDSAGEYAFGGPRHKCASRDSRLSQLIPHASLCLHSLSPFSVFAGLRSISPAYSSSVSLYQASQFTSYHQSDRTRAPSPGVFWDLHPCTSPNACIQSSGFMR